MYVVTWQDNGRKLWERASNRAFAEAMANRRHGSWAYVTI